MARKYTVDSDELTRTVQRAGHASGRGIGERHWRLLSLIAQHGVLDTHQVTILMFGSRPSAARHLSSLVKAGLLRRFVDTRDSAHRAHYEVSAVGAELLEQRLRHTGQPVPLGLGRRGRTHAQLVVNRFFVRLAAHARTTGEGNLYRWRHALDTAAWLRSRGVLDIDVQGYGMWIEDGRVVSFLLHLDDDLPTPLTQTPPPPPSTLLDGYRWATAGVPVDVALVVAPSAEREQLLHSDIEPRPISLPVGATTTARLESAASPAEAIWSVAGVSDLVRLIDLRQAATNASRR